MILTFTQPVMYQAVKSHSTTVTLYEQHLLREGIPSEEIEAVKKKSRDKFEEAFSRFNNEGVEIHTETLQGTWSGFTRIDPAEPDTTVSAPEIQAVADIITRAPNGFQVHPKVLKLLEGRRAMSQGKARMDWGMGEALAYATLLRQGTSIRISGQDVKRGTFSHRHAVLFDFQNGEEFSVRWHRQHRKALILKCSTAFSPKRPCWVLSLDTPLPIRTRL